MPRKLVLTFEPGPRRWRRVYRGKTYTVSCRALGVAETKLDSYQAANAWWAAKRAEIDQAPPPPPPTWVEEEIAGFRELAREMGPAGEELAARVERLAARIGDPAILGWATPGAIEEARARGAAGDAEAAARREAGTPSLHDRMMELHASRWDPARPPGIDEVGEGMRGVVEEAGRAALARRSGPAPVDRTIGARVDAYLAEERARVDADELSAAEWANRKILLRHLTDWAGAATPIDALADEARWASLYQFLLGKVASKSWSKTTADKVLRSSRRFVEHLAARRLIEAPRNLADRGMKFTIAPRAIEVFTVEEVRGLIEAATGQLKLHLLMMANIGCTQQDLSDLAPGEVRWGTGEITRKRSKTSDHESVPTVTYRLWPRTFELLQQYRSSDPERVLLTKAGLPWVDKRDKHSDSIRTNYQRLARKVGARLSLKYIRKTSATLIESNREFQGVTEMFLGHSPRGIKAVHYAQGPQETLHAAVEWLGRQYGYVE